MELMELAARTGLAQHNASPNPLWQSGTAGRVHMVGLGGSGMRVLAEVLHGQGWEVQGSDASTEACAEILARGISARLGHSATNVDPTAKLVIHSAAVGHDNPELQQAARLGIPIVSYAEMLGRLMVGPLRLAVAGTHGKSTITAMTEVILRAAGHEPTVVYGASPMEPPCPAKKNQHSIQPVLVEACEYQRNFLHLRPNREVISCIEPDHFDCYPTQTLLFEAFIEFVKLLPSDGLLITAADSAAQQVAREARCRRETFGLTAESDWRATNIEPNNGRYRFDLSNRRRNLGSVQLRVVGRHNVLNSLAAAALAASAGAPEDSIVDGLSRFAGLRRRMEYLGRVANFELWDDYAHHPTEIAAAVATLREIYPHARLGVVFEPHQMSRTGVLLEEFASAFSPVDLVAVTDIFRAREEEMKTGVTAADLSRRIRQHGTQVLEAHDLDQIGERLLAACPPVDVIVTMGAGLVHTVARRLQSVGYVQHTR
jgi:UDP-N-acetylmuramate--alanine ligase